MRAGIIRTDTRWLQLHTTHGILWLRNKFNGPSRPAVSYSIPCMGALGPTAPSMYSGSSGRQRLSFVPPLSLC